MDTLEQFSIRKSAGALLHINIRINASTGSGIHVVPSRLDRTLVGWTALVQQTASTQSNKLPSFLYTAVAATFGCVPAVPDVFLLRTIPSDRLESIVPRHRST